MHLKKRAALLPAAGVRRKSLKSLGVTHKPSEKPVPNKVEVICPSSS